MRSQQDFFFLMVHKLNLGRQTGDEYGCLKILSNNVRISKRSRIQPWVPIKVWMSVITYIVLNMDDLQSCFPFKNTLRSQGVFGSLIEKEHVCA